MIRTLEQGTGAFVADIHMDIPFVEKKHGPVVERLVNLARQHDWLVLGGDTTELVHVPAYMRLRHLDAIVRSGWSPAFQAFRKIYTVQMDGNHDPKSIYLAYDTPYWKELGSNIVFPYGGQLYQAFHGHIYDNLGVVDPLLAFFGKRLDPVIKKLDHFFIPPGMRRHAGGTMYDRWAARPLQRIRANLRPGVRAVVGHFHIVIDEPQIISPGLTNHNQLQFVRFSRGKARVLIDRYYRP